MRDATIRVYQDNSDEWRWHLRHWNGNIIAESGEGYSSRERAREGLDSTIANIASATIAVESERDEDVNE